MAETAFETFDPAHLTAQMKVLVVDPEDPDTPNTVIETDDEFQINVDWQLDGIAAPYVGGTWTVRAYLDDRDGIAPSSGPVGPTMIVPVGLFIPPTLPRKYSTIILVKDHKVQAGLYDLTVAITYDNGVKLSMAGFSTGPVLQFYDKADA